jgi:glyoxylase-like metal-dependent hydrolase (beta-lactamase superfamily II)
VEFPASVEVVTHENTKTNMDRMASPPGFQAPAAAKPTIFAAHGGRGLPTRTFTDRVTLGSGPDRVDVYHFGRGHTNGDAIVAFPALRVMHMGDLFPGKRVPIMDSNNGGSGIAYADTLRHAHDGVPSIERIITGHSTVMSPGDLLEYSEFIRGLVDTVRAGKKAGQSAQQIAETWKIPAQYAGYTAPQPQSLRPVVELIYKELE